MKKHKDEHNRPPLNDRSGAFLNPVIAALLLR